MYLPRGRTMRASKTNGHHPVDTQFAAIGNRLRSESDLPYSAGAESYAEHSRQLALVPVWIKELRNYPVRSMHQIGGLRDHRSYIRLARTYRRHDIFYLGWTSQGQLVKPMSGTEIRIGEFQSQGCPWHRIPRIKCPESLESRY
ncbi:hypothetical protein AG1IA_01885 [Rhizoctonia solani AG-1 IA]|uniref:Uncharacterized protein n=1 Tax=Thanatephorus cucumeris (strain AG1-IA) TaxID=983506 RepID=L8X618_THACA|nr:hypothetical protein AG1IA_01885 [Rhizoctonia solani AG-1 IA]